ncbi:MAG TPA: hypothetical protein VHO03_02070 [Ignavibacteriales bacterium]|nr:hypothetical protein [Ignavibacteriales bacterium]
MKVKLFAMVIAAAFLMTGLNSSFAQEKVAVKTKTEQKVAAKDTKKVITKVKTAKKKAITHKCTDKEKESCTKSCESKSCEQE